MTTGATVEGPEGVALDPAAGRIYWGNYGPGDGDTIAYANLDGSGHAHNLPTAPVVPNRPHGVALDPAAGRIYWPNYGSWTISYANLDGSGGANVPTTGATVNGPDLPALLEVPAAAGAPRISGGAIAGSKLSCSRGRWASDLVTALLYRAPRSFSYQWTLDGRALAGASSNSITASSPGEYRCLVTARNQAGHTRRTSAPHRISSFILGRVARDKRKGTAKLTVRIPGPGVVTLSKGGKLKRISRHPGAGGRLRLAIKPRGSTARLLDHRGRAKVRPAITYIPTGGSPDTLRKAIELVRRTSR